MNFKNSIMCLNREKLNTMNNKYIYEDYDEKLQNSLRLCENISTKLV
jgi:hypothetical protein